jgi:hypothetical protein
MLLIYKILAAISYNVPAACRRIFCLSAVFSFILLFLFNTEIISGVKVQQKISPDNVSAQQLPVFDFLQYAHLPDGDFVQLYQAFALREFFVDEYGVDVFHVREANLWYFYFSTGFLLHRPYVRRFYTVQGW